MSVSEAHLRDGSDPAQAALLRARSLIEEALTLIDDHVNDQELAARLNDLIERLKARSS